MEATQDHKIIILLANHTASGIVRFANDENEIPGIVTALNAGASKDVIALEAARFLEDDGLAVDIEVVGEFTPLLTLPNGDPGVLVLTVLKRKTIKNNHEWVTLPELIRAMPRDRNRIAYMKTIQYFAGCDKENIEAVELDENARRAIRKNLGMDE
ncbi:MAG: hypothetical protein AB7T49_20540 [Oligoflexales bacterium]